MHRLTSARNLLGWIGLASLLGLLAGCGEAGNNVSGTVTFDGKPVPAGTIYFTPDSSKGNSGATGYATIEDGEYDTSASGGKPVGAVGAMIVRIDGFDPSAKAESPPDAPPGEEVIPPLFPTYQTTAELAEGGATKDFEIPAEAAHVIHAPEGKTGFVP